MGMIFGRTDRRYVVDEAKAPRFLAKRCDAAAAAAAALDAVSSDIHHARGASQKVSQ